MTQHDATVKHLGRGVDVTMHKELAGSIAGGLNCLFLGQCLDFVGSPERRKSPKLKR